MLRPAKHRPSELPVFSLCGEHDTLAGAGRQLESVHTGLIATRQRCGWEIASHTHRDP